jgi:hypothetical protein
MSGSSMNAMRSRWPGFPVLSWRERSSIAPLERVRDSVRPGGWIVFGLYAPAADPLGEALTNLRIVRGGGHPWSAAEVETRLSGLGFDDVETFAPGPPILFVVGQRRN